MEKPFIEYGIVQNGLALNPGVTWEDCAGNHTIEQPAERNKKPRPRE